MGNQRPIPPMMGWSSAKGNPKKRKKANTTFNTGIIFSNKLNQ